MKLLFESAPLGIFTYSKTGVVLGANQFLLDILGSPSLESTRQINVFTLENLRTPGVSQMLEKALETGQPQRLETPYMSKWGKQVHLVFIALPLIEDDGVMEKGIGIIQDLTPLKKTEENLRESEERFRMLTDKTPLGIAIVGQGNRFDYMNPTFLALFGYSPDEIPTFESWLENSMCERESQIILSTCLSSQSNSSYEMLQRHFEIRCKDGSTKDVRFRVFSLSERKRVLICEDNSDLFRALLGQRHSEKRYLTLLENLTDFVYTLDPDGTILSINRAAAQTLGYEVEELLGESIEKLIPPDVRILIPENMAMVVREGFAEGISKYVAKNGALHYLEYRSVLIRPDNRPQYVVGIARDVTDRMLTKKALKESETKFKLIVENAHDGITHVDENGLIKFCNARMKEILKDENPEGKPLHAYFDAENTVTLENNLMVRSKGVSGTYFISLKDLEGNDHKMVVSGTPYFSERGTYRGAIGVFTEISELRKLEEQLQHSQKMEAIGTLAGGIAHDFNNILSGVLGYASLLKKYAAAGSQLAHYGEMIEKSAERGAMLAGQLLAFSRKGKRFVQDVDVHQLMKEIVELLERTVDRKISVLSRTDSENSVIEGDSGQIQQVLMNLCLNAKDAMPDGGQLILSTRDVFLDESFCSANQELIPGLFLEISVKDSGEGMSEPIKRRLFEPFFTTKAEGKGTGLGLSMVYGTVKSHGGMVTVDSEVGRGSVFTVLLPLKEQASRNTAACPLPGTTRGSGRILIVDDEEIIRHLLGEMLQELGFSVLTAEDGLEGLEIYRKEWQNIDLVLIDMIMPRLNGKETFIEMKKINPCVRAVLSTGFTKDSAVQDTLDQGIVTFVQKPYRLEELSAAISHALHEP
ncbi:MAG TPA: PAS domain S-box protein [Desulfomonilaceae bacterium]|nr:PAS domain S-box protein [Desulfomonilaceae bacterium]